jgi:hypothetical protein
MFSLAQQVSSGGYQQSDLRDIARLWKAGQSICGFTIKSQGGQCQVIWTVEILADKRFQQVICSGCFTNIL